MVLLEKLSVFLSTYRWLVDSFIIVSARDNSTSISDDIYVQEFFVEGHWDKLPDAWKERCSILGDGHFREIAAVVLGGSSGGGCIDSVPIKT